MRLTGIELEGYRCYEAVELSVEPGVTVIHGVNGAGKTTLLEAVLFGLYGPTALGDATMADIVTRGAEAAAVALSFVHDGGTYRLDREVSSSGERVTTRSCTLVEPDGTVHEGASTVADRVASMLRMDAEAFVNSAYVKQGEINKLLHATPDERQSMIDDLLQLGRLETYHDRADDTRLAVRSLARERAEVVRELERQRDRLADDEPHERLNDLEGELATVARTIDELQARRDVLVAERDELTDEREQLDSLLGERDELRERRGAIVEALEELSERRTTVREGMAEARERRREARTALEDRLDAAAVDSVDEVEPLRTDIEATIDRVETRIEEERQEIETARERLAAITERQHAIAERIEEERGSLEAEAEQLEEDIAVLEEREAERESIAAELETATDDLEADAADAETLARHASDLEAALETRRADRRDRRDERAALAEHIEQATALADEDRCPTCGQPVDASPHLDQLDDDRERLASLNETIKAHTAAIEDLESRIETVESALTAANRLDQVAGLIQERESIITERRGRIDERTGSIEAAEEELTGLERAEEAVSSTLDEAQSTIAEANDELQRHRTGLHDLEAIEEAAAELEEAEDQLERLSERREHLDELEQERSAQLEDLDSRLASVEDRLEEQPMDDLEDRLETVTDELESVETSLTDAREARDELTEAIGSIRSDIERLEEVTADLETARSRQADLEGLQEEATQLGELYSAVRADLRERNVATLERLLNETFELLYRNDAYERIDLDLDYELTVHSKDGAELDPSQLSGGERAIFNLSLRCAIYRLLAEGVEGAAPMPPLMLDEPTVFLDQGHVGRLIRLLETMREFGVEQTLVVSHHEALLDAAEHRIAVEKDPTTNRSHIAELAATTPP